VSEAIREANFKLEKSRPCVYLEEEIFSELVAIGVDLSLLMVSIYFLFNIQINQGGFLIVCSKGERIFYSR
jgi:hypothetical protein